MGFLLLNNAWASILMYHAGVLLTMLLFRKNELWQNHPNTKAIHYLSLLVFVSGGAVFYVVMPFFASADDIASKLAVMGLGAKTWPYFAVYFCLVNACLEEIFWRGYLAPETRGLHYHDIMFGGYHGLVILWFAEPYWAIPVLAATAFAGWLWRTMRRITGSLTLPILTHIAADASIIAAVHFRIFER